MPTTIQALIILLLVIAPGYLFALTLLKSIANISTSEWRFLLTTIILGAIVHASVSYWTVELVKIYDDDPQRLYNHVPQLMLWAAITLFIVPIGLGLGLGWLARTEIGDKVLTWLGFGYLSLLPSAWEYVFHKDDGAFVRVHLKDGGVIGGRFSTDSFAADPPGVSDLYIEEAWVFDEDNDFQEAVPASRGIWISRDAIAYITFHNAGTPGSENKNEQHTTASTGEDAGPAEPTPTGHEGQPAEEPGREHSSTEDAKAAVEPSVRE